MSAGFAGPNAKIRKSCDNRFAGNLLFSLYLCSVLHAGAPPSFRRPSRLLGTAAAGSRRCVPELLRLHPAAGRIRSVRPATSSPPPNGEARPALSGRASLAPGRAVSDAPLPELFPCAARYSTAADSLTKSSAISVSASFVFFSPASSFSSSFLIFFSGR